MIFSCPPLWLDYLVGWNGGIVVGLVIGFWLGRHYLVVTPTEYSQTHPNGDAGGL